jgi:RHS repeat-associated protein
LYVWQSDPGFVPLAQLDRAQSALAAAAPGSQEQELARLYLMGLRYFRAYGEAQAEVTGVYESRVVADVQEGTFAYEMNVTKVGGAPMVGTRDSVIADGTLRSSRRFEAFGAVRGDVEAAADTPWGFQGRRMDSLVPELIYYRARYFDSSSGTFLSRDPASFSMARLPDDQLAAGAGLGSRQLAGGYALAAQDPIRFRDPSGLIFGIEFIDVGIILDLAWEGLAYPITSYLEDRVLPLVRWECQSCNIAYFNGRGYSRELLNYRIPAILFGRDSRLPNGDAPYHKKVDPGHRNAVIFNATQLELAGTTMLRTCAQVAMKMLGVWYVAAGGLAQVDWIINMGGSGRPN